jgi:hypothetical protein
MKPELWLSQHFGVRETPFALTVRELSLAGPDEEDDRRNCHVQTSVSGIEVSAEHRRLGGRAASWI